LNFEIPFIPNSKYHHKDSCFQNSQITAEDQILSDLYVLSYIDDFMFHHCTSFVFKTLAEYFPGHAEKS